MTPTDQPATCPTCYSDDPRNCGWPHRHAPSRCCPHPFHSPAPAGRCPTCGNEKDNPASQGGMSGLLCPDEFHESVHPAAPAGRVQDPEAEQMLDESLASGKPPPTHPEAAPAGRVEGEQRRALEGLPPRLAEALRDPSIVVPKDSALFNLIAEWQNAPSNTASAALPAPEGKGAESCALDRDKCITLPPEPQQPEVEGGVGRCRCELTHSPPTEDCPIHAPFPMYCQQHAVGVHTAPFGNGPPLEDGCAPKLWRDVAAERHANAIARRQEARSAEARLAELVEAVEQAMKEHRDGWGEVTPQNRRDRVLYAALRAAADRAEQVKE